MEEKVTIKGEEIRKLIAEGNIVIGTERTMKELKKGNLSTVYLSSNVQDSLKKDISYYTGLQGVEVMELGIPNSEVGILCKKPFAISLMGRIKS